MKKNLPPVLIKDREELDWPEDRMFYVLSRSGMFICRNHPFFRSCAPIRSWPSELAGQRSFLEPDYPEIPGELFARVVGFFARVAELHGSEAGVHLLWDRTRERVEVLVPEQVATVRRGWQGQLYPVGLHYQSPTELPSTQFLLGDIHSHVHSPAFASGTDVHDETHRPGLHIVVGRIDEEPPDVHVEAVVDGARFPLPAEQVIAGYERRSSDFPEEWIEKVRIEDSSSAWRETCYSYGYGSTQEARQYAVPSIEGGRH